ncbi:MAG: glycoside hydrolase [Candidatus Eremiobacteraeota bacterium]|nr:glycoside hydrolase [Candidatus Eremiobacteraeota bacterium]
MQRRFIAALVAAALISAAPPARAQTSAVSPSLYQSLRWRFIGPLRGGRTVALDGIAGEPNVFYIGAVNGGIWKTQDAGRTWTPIFDREATGSIGAIAVAPSDPRVVYAGSGEGLQRPDLSVGDGIYKSADGGATWTHLGLRGARQIASMAVDPANPNRLFVAVLGHPYGPNDERGVYRSLDGGATFRRVLFGNQNVGAFDVVLDPRDPRVVYATLWAARQAPWEIGASFEMSGSGVFKSTDGGTTWTQLRYGLPPQIGRAEVAVARSNPQVVYAYTDVKSKDTENGALYRSADGGAHFALVNSADEIAQRGDDLISLAVDPTDPNVVYLTNTSTYRSTDGGKTMVAIKGAPGGDDYHTVWINPRNPRIVALASDQGATISVDGGVTWSSWYNQPTAQMYHANATSGFPYWVCGGQQESGSACVASRGNWGEVTERDWHTAGAQEYGYVVPDPLHRGILFGGKVEKFDEVTGQVQEVSPIALPTKRYRVVRTEPLAFDHFDKRRLYFGSNVVFTTTNGGRSWQAISPDLTRTHPAVPAIIEPFEGDDPQHGAHRGVVYALAPSYVRAGTVWAGTDDGLVWITRDSGRHWRNVTPPELTPWSKVAQIDASRFDDGTAFVAVNRFRLDDMRPYVYVTHDGGATWRLAVAGLPDQPVNAVRQDPGEPNLLYAATENGVAVSFDGGARWQSLQLDLPHTSVRDLIVHGDDVVVATHGRGFWILDDVEPLRELARLPRVETHLFTPALAYRVRRSTNTDTPLPPEEPMGTNPPDGAILDYALGAPARHVVISILDGTGNVVRRYASDDPPPPSIEHLDKPAYWERPFAAPPASAGMHRFVWDLREAPPHSLQPDLPISAVPHDTPRVPEGVLVVPGRYTVRLDVDARAQERPLTVAMDPRVAVSRGALEQQYRLGSEIAAIMNRSYDANAAAKRARHASAAGAFASLNADAQSLLDTVEGADAPPTLQAAQAVRTLEGRLAAIQNR